MNSKRTFSSFSSLLSTAVVSVWSIVLQLPNASSAPHSVEFWSPEPDEWIGLVVPVVGSRAATATAPFSTSPPSPLTISNATPTVRTERSRGRFGNKTRTPKRKNKKRNDENKTDKNNNQRPAAVIRNKIVVKFDAGTPPPQRASPSSPSSPSGPTKTAETDEQKTPDGCKRTGRGMTADWTVCSLLIVMTLWFCNLTVREIRGRCFRGLL